MGSRSRCDVILLTTTNPCKNLSLLWQRSKALSSCTWGFIVKLSLYAWSERWKHGVTNIHFHNKKLYHELFG
jgi:hypothetical protein